MQTPPVKSDWSPQQVSDDEHSESDVQDTDDPARPDVNVQTFEVQNGKDKGQSKSDEQAVSKK